MNTPERLSGAVYGHLVGDALGVAYEFAAPERIGDVRWRGHGAHGQPPGTWSDDGALMLALLDSLLPELRKPERPGDTDHPHPCPGWAQASPGFDPEDQGRRALAWWRTGAYAPGGTVFDIGGATSSALRRIEAGTPAIRAGAPDAKGNGSLMRILPLALVMRDSHAVPDAELVRLAGVASGVTHGSAEARIACSLYSLAVRDVLAGERDRRAILDGATAVVRASPPEGTTLDDLETFLAWPGREGRGRVVDSFWSAWDAFAETPGYREAVVRAVAYGHDTDTTAAIAGGLAGAYWGIDAIPQAWLGDLRDRYIPQALVDRLVWTDGWRTSACNPLRLDMLELADLAPLEGIRGRIGLTFLPGKKRDGISGKHWRDLQTDVRRLRETFGVATVVSFVEDKELEWCRVTSIADVMAAHGIELVRHPIDDITGRPDDMTAYRVLIRVILDRVQGGGTVAICCRGGLDRTGMAAGCLLREAGLEADGPDGAIARVHRARRRTLTRPDQQRIVREWRTT